MAVKLRMTRMGRRHRPFFRINAVESRTPRDGKILEKLGHYDPIEKDPAKQIVLNRERTEYWLDKGAIPSDTVSQILLRQGIKNEYAKERVNRRAKARALARKKGRPFTKAEKEKLAVAKQAPPAEEKAQTEPKAEKEKLAAGKQAPPAEEKAVTEPKAEAEAKSGTESAEEKVEAETKAVEEKTEPEAAANDEPEAKAKAEAETKADEEKAE